jgi:Domain of unknown function (DUF1707)
MTAPAQLRTVPHRSGAARSGSAAGDPPGASVRPAPRLRASNADRMAVVARLHDAVGLGYLTLEEGDERVVAAFGARYADELPELTEDLPVPAAVPVAPGWRAITSSAALQARTSLLGAPTWRQADVARRRVVATIGTLLAVLFIVLVTASAASAGGGGGGGAGGYSYDDNYSWHHHHHHGHYDDD